MSDMEITGYANSSGHISTAKTMLRIEQPSTDGLLVRSDEFEPSHCPACGQRIAHVVLTEKVANAAPCGHALEAVSVRATWLE